MSETLFRHILMSRVYEAAVETPLEPSPWLSTQLGNDVLVKREDLQPVFSFKLRGAYNKIAHLTDEERERGIIAASAGNHAQGVAFSARELGLEATIVMPVTTPAIKVDAVKRFGAQVVLHGDNYSIAADYCKQLSQENGMTFIHPFDDELVIAGQGTVGYEIMRQSGGRLDAIYVPVGGGGLIAGIGAYVKNLNPSIRVIGVEPEDSDAMARSLEAGKLVSLDQVGIFADGVAVREVGPRTFELCQEYVDEIVRVSTDEICSAIKWTYQATRTIVEPAGALSLAGMRHHVQKNGIRDQRLVAINSGANMNFERLRYVTERTMVGEQREALFAITLPEKPGALRHFCQDVVQDHNITEFNYRLANRDEAHIFVGIDLRRPEERQMLAQRLSEGGFRYEDLTDNNLAKTHVRHMVGGRSSVVSHERLFRFRFPERPGALSDFLSSMQAHWNISLFHYRLHGGDFGRVLIGLEVQEGEREALAVFLDKLGYSYVEETDNPAYKMFL
uniref:L-threonine dehydratase n=1 Tax=Magnetococcus massalia (strain MO-1) TaxID=451514 RepID=A0A1S7LKU3_MAGMO|nr:Threonine dehydratase biosynthetic [Candidatus Magnetococcus massalia]